jgi:hypothetical protein
MQLAELIGDWIAGEDVNDKIEAMIGEDRWFWLNAVYKFSRESYDQDEYDIVDREF